MLAPGSAASQRWQQDEQLWNLHLGAHTCSLALFLLHYLRCTLFRLGVAQMPRKFLGNISKSQLRVGILLGVIITFLQPWDQADVLYISTPNTEPLCCKFVITATANLSDHASDDDNVLPIPVPTKTCLSSLSWTLPLFHRPEMDNCCITGDTWCHQFSWLCFRRNVDQGCTVVSEG